MKKLVCLLALMLLLAPTFVYAAPPGCTWEGDPSFRYGWNYRDGLPYNQPGPDAITMYAGQSKTKQLGPYNSAPSWLPAGCKNTDTLCAEFISANGWTMTYNPPLGPQILGSSYLWYQNVTIAAPCNAALGHVERIIARCNYVNNAGVCDSLCGDCNDPNVRPADGLNYYSADTLYITVVAAPPGLGILQDSLTLVEQGQTEAYITFGLCNTDPCAPPARIDYSIKNKGHVDTLTVWTGYVTPPGGECRDAFATLNADTTHIDVLDTLTIIAWMGVPAVYDTCVQLVKVIEPRNVPLFTVPVVTILVLALILAAAVFMRRRAVSRA